MLFLYPFDLYGIIYTSVIGGLSLLALIVLLRLAVAKKPSTAGTVAFRIFSFIWMLVLVVLWCAYVLMKIEVLGVSFAGVTEGLVLQYNGTALFVIPFIGFLPGIFNTILGTILLGLVTLLSFINLILSFACRKKKAVAKTPAPEVVAEETPEPAPEVVTEETPEPAPEVVAEEQPEPAPEVVTEEPPEPAPEVVAEEQPEPAPEVVAEEQPEPAPEVVAEEEYEPAPEVVAEEQPEPAPEVVAEETPEPILEAVVEETPAPAPEAVAKEPANIVKAEAQRAPFKKYVEVGRIGGNVSKKNYSSSVKKPDRKKSNADDQGELLAIQMPPLPVTRKLVITNRMNVVNMFNNYLNDKEKAEREKISGNIGKIIIK